HPLRHEADDRLLRLAELGRTRMLDADGARGLDAGHLHAETDAEIGHLMNAREGGRPDLALRAPLAEAARNEDAVHALEPGRRVLLLEDLGLDPLHVDLDAVGDA